MVDMSEIINFSKNLNLLYVEDNKASREITILLLSNLFDNIVVAEDGIDGLENFRNDEIDLVLSDVTMPKMDGIEMVKEIHKISNIPIILLSAYDKDFLDEIEDMNLYYLLKPIDLNQFLEILSKIKNSLR